MARTIFKCWFVDFDPVHAKSAFHTPGNLRPEIAELFPNAFEDSELAEIPKGWRAASILETAELLSGGTPKTSEPAYWGGSILWVSAADVSQCGELFLIDTDRTITQSGLENTQPKSSHRWLPLSLRGATTGRMTMFGSDIAMNQTCYALRTNQETPRFLHFMLQHEIESLVQTAHGSVFDTITTATFRSSCVVIPPKSLAQAFESHISSLTDRVLSNLYESRTLAASCDALLPKLISGELRVPDAERVVGRMT